MINIRLNCVEENIGDQEDTAIDSTYNKAKIAQKRLDTVNREIMNCEIISSFLHMSNSSLRRKGESSE